MDTEEMYRRGVADAERDDLHPFYYQHYYHYRRGFDRTRRRLRQPFGIGGTRGLLLFALVAVVVAGTAFWSLQRGDRPDRQPALATGQGPTATPLPVAPTRQALFPTVTPTLEPTPVGLHVGGRAVIANIASQSLRGRTEPSVNAKVQVTFKEGEEVAVIEGPTDADGYRWWRIEGARGNGWSAEQSPEGIVWIQPLAEQPTASTP